MKTREEIAAMIVDLEELLYKGTLAMEASANRIDELKANLKVSTARIEALEAALREIDDISTCRIARRLASEALAPEQDK